MILDAFNDHCQPKNHSSSLDFCLDLIFEQLLTMTREHLKAAELELESLINIIFFFFSEMYYSTDRDYIKCLSLSSSALFLLIKKISGMKKQECGIGQNVRANIKNHYELHTFIMSSNKSLCCKLEFPKSSCELWD